VVQGEPRRVGVVAVERAVALLRDVELRPEDEPQALEPAEPGAEVVLAQRVRVRRALELLERTHLPVEQARPDQARVLGVRRVVVLTSSFPRDESDFAGRFVADAVGQLRARGLEVEVVCPRRAGDGALVPLLRRRPWLAVSLFFGLLRELRRAAA